MDKPYGTAAVFLMAMTAFSAPVEANTHLTLNTDNGGLVVSSDDNSSRFQLGARLQWDLDLYKDIFNRDQNGDTAHDTEIRRGRIELAGTVERNFHYEMTLDVEPQSRWHLAYLHYTGLSYINWTVGRFKEPFGLQALTSSNDLITIERSLIFDSTNSGVADFGVQASNHWQRWTWALGLFHDADLHETASGKDVYALSGRTSYALLDTVKRLIHVGASYSERNIFDYSDPRFNSQGLITTLSVNSADELSLLLDDTREDRQLGAEGLYQDGPLRFQGEYIQRHLEAGSGIERTLNGYYLQASVLLNGGMRGFDLRRGIPMSLQPGEAYGTWELAGRWDKQLVEQSGSDGEIDALTLGVNWYANRYIKWMLHYSYVTTDDLVDTNSSGHALSGRMQLAF